MTAFEIFVSIQNSFWITHRVADHIQPQATSDGKVPGSWWAEPPPGEIHVGRAPRTRVGEMFIGLAAILASGAEKRPGRQQARLLKLRMEVGSGSRVIRHIAEQVVTARAVPAATANQGMVAEAVQDAVAARA